MTARLSTHPCARCGMPMSGNREICRRHDVGRGRKLAWHRIGRDVQAYQRVIRGMGLDSRPLWVRAMEGRR